MSDVFINDPTSLRERLQARHNDLAHTTAGGHYSIFKEADDRIEQQAARIKELEDTLREIRSHMEMRMVHGFDFQTGEYPVTSETIEVLCTENNAMRKKIEQLKAERDEAREIAETFRSDPEVRVEVVDSILSGLYLPWEKPE